MNKAETVRLVSLFILVAYVSGSMYFSVFTKTLWSRFYFKYNDQDYHIDASISGYQLCVFETNIFDNSKEALCQPFYNWGDEDPSIPESKAFDSCKSASSSINGMSYAIIGLEIFIFLFICAKKLGLKVNRSASVPVNGFVAVSTTVFLIACICLWSDQCHKKLISLGHSLTNDGVLDSFEGASYY